MLTLSRRDEAVRQTKRLQTDYFALQAKQAAKISS
jgi:hypothetical protein